MFKCIYDDGHNISFGSCWCSHPAAGHFLLLCAVPALDFGESIGGEYFFASVVSDANP